MKKSNTETNDAAQQAAAEQEQRFMQIEIKLSYTEDLVDSLNQLVTKQQLQLDQLIQEVVRLRHEQTQSGGFRSLRDDLPPHY